MFTSINDHTLFFHTIVFYFDVQSSRYQFHLVDLNNIHDFIHFKHKIEHVIQNPQKKSVACYTIYLTRKGGKSIANH